MDNPKILVFSGSTRSGSLNSQLAALAAKELAIADANVTRISLEDYPLPLHPGDPKVPAHPAAIKLKRQVMQHRGVFIASPEYNASVTPLLKNALDWISHVREDGEPLLAAYRNRVFAVGSASPGVYGGMRSLMALRQILELGCGALVLPEQVAVREAAKAFDGKGNLIDEPSADLLRALLRKLVTVARLM
jgi:NAD(P)H-dependent FMN reductase